MMLSVDDYISDINLLYLKKIILEERKQTDLYVPFQIDDDQLQIVDSSFANNDNGSDDGIGTESTSEGPPSDEIGSPECIREPALSLQRSSSSVMSFESESIQLDSYHQVRIEDEINPKPTVMPTVMSSAAEGPPTLTKPADAADAEADSITRENGERNDYDDNDDDDDDVDDYRPVIVVNDSQLPAGPANPLQIGDEFRKAVDDEPIFASSSSSDYGLVSLEFN